MDIVLRNPGSIFNISFSTASIESAFYTMVGSPTGWVWKKATIDVDSARKSSSNDMLSWDWGTFTVGSGYYPSSSSEATAPLMWNMSIGA